MKKKNVHQPPNQARNHDIRINNAPVFPLILLMWVLSPFHSSNHLVLYGTAWIMLLTASTQVSGYPVILWLHLHPDPSCFSGSGRSLRCPDCSFSPPHIILCPSSLSSLMPILYTHQSWVPALDSIYLWIKDSESATCEWKREKNKEGWHQSLNQN